MLGPEEAVGPCKVLGSSVAVPSTVHRRPVPSAPGTVRVSARASQGTDVGVIDLRAVNLRAVNLRAVNLRAVDLRAVDMRAEGPAQSA
jgi:hypothetical protein